MKRSAFAPRHKNAPRPAEKSALGYLQWLRGRECLLLHKGGCGGPIVAAHVDHAGGKGMGSKVADKHALPMCDGHHTEQHRIGWKTFEAKYEMNAPFCASLFWRNWPGRRAWEEKNG